MDRFPIQYVGVLLLRLERHTAALACAAVICTSGCGDVEPSPTITTDASVAPAADGGTDGSQSTAELDGRVDTTQASSTDITADDASIGSRFEIALSTSDCQGGCPIYDLMFDHTGSVMFNGRGNTRQQGWGGRMVPPETAAELLELIVAANYWKLQDVYRETKDGCSEVEADRTTYTWNVTMDGPAKIVIDYQGCKGVREVEELRKIPALLIDRLGLGIYLGR